MQIERGIIPALMKSYKAAAATGGQVSSAEDKKILQRGLRLINEEFEGASSEAGLAKARNALATTRRAAAKNWDFTAKADRTAEQFLGEDLDGKGGKLAALERKIRSDIRGGGSVYGGGGGGRVSGGGRVGGGSVYGGGGGGGGWVYG